MARVFISYATSDRMLADEVSRWLRAEGHEPFLAHDLRDGISAGEDWRSRLYRELRKVDAVIGVVTSSFIASNWCAAELGIADALGRPLLPLRAEDNVVHPLMPHLQYVDYLADPEQARERLLQAVRMLEGRERKPWTRAKISLIAVLSVALVAGMTIVVALLIDSAAASRPGTQPAPATTRSPAVAARIPKATCPTCAPGGKTFTEQVHTSNPAGTTTFKDPLGFGGQGIRVFPGQRVEVVCRFFDPNAPPTVLPGWWYLIDSPPWNRQYFTPANSYLNGDPPEGPYGTDVDERVPVC